jgi:DNA mismatch repair protein MutS
MAKKKAKRKASDGITPAMRQYLEAKEQVPDALLLFRMGDFYEVFFEDAEVAAPLMEIALTSRSSKGSENRIPMCGVPYHALNTYVSRLLKAGRKVAICEQMEDPSKAKGIVRREIVRVVSPGVNLDIDSLDSGSNNYLAAMVSGMDGIGFAVLDASTGDFRACKADDATQLRIELARLDPREIVYPERMAGKVEKLLAVLPNASRHGAADSHFEVTTAKAELDGLADPAELPLELVQAAGGLVSYLKSLQRADDLQLEPLATYAIDNFLVLDETAVADLELLKTISGGEKRGSLLGLMDCTASAMGARLLRRWIAYPLVDRDDIERRLDAVAELLASTMLRDELRVSLKKLYDMERLATRVVTGQANPKELYSLALSTGLLSYVKGLLEDCSSHALTRIAGALRPSPEPLAEALEFMVENPPINSREGGIFRPEYDDELRELLDLTRGGKEWLLEYEAQQRQETGINALKIRYNKVFGYYIEISRANLHLAPEHYIRKQTLVNAERFFTPELKEHEEKVLHAQDLAYGREEEFFLDLMGRVADHRSAVLEAAAAVAELDVLLSFATLAHTHDYCRPELDYEDVLELKENRHPVVEKVLPAGKFVPNDIYLDNDEQQLMIITGPNMAGKSTVMRQVALTVIMAQMGSFVPARSARIGMVDRVFTRVGATDSLARGLSTFMVEMTEAAEIMKRASKRSLLILDEVGRGTSTYDGLSIAWSMCEYIHDFLRAKTLFATHYHELTQLSEYKKRVRNFSIAVKEFNDEILFLHRLVKGATNRSYGVQVARLAGVPRPVIDRAKEILASLEDGTGDISIERPKPGKRKRATGLQQPSLFAPKAPPPAVDKRLVKLEKRFRGVSLDTIAPIEALNLLYQWKKELESDGE